MNENIRLHHEWTLGKPKSEASFAASGCYADKFMKTKLQEAYNALLQRKREIEILDQNGTAICRNCGGEKKPHYSDGTGRCSTSALTRNFVSVDKSESDKIEAALPPIEALLSA